jgi:hypothetical protein
LNIYNHYKLKKSHGGFLPVEVNGDKVDHFISPDTKSVPKLYVVKHNQDICYAGITSQSISSRLRIGFKAAGEHGYHGYKWKDEIDQADLLIWAFDKGTSIEPIEAELVYFIREKTGKWPKYQMEIHFHHEVTEKERQLARSILSVLLN